MENRHILLTGAVGSGKSTLIRRLLASCPLPLTGFFTRGEAPDENGIRRVYLYPAGAGDGPRVTGNLAGLGGRSRTGFPEVFDSLGVEYLTRPGGLVVMDELGTMEGEARRFQSAVFARLDGDVPVIAVVKAETGPPFLERVRSHPKTRLYTVTRENREALYAELLPRVRAFIREKGGTP